MPTARNCTKTPTSPKNRVHIACEPCRKKKRKCDGEKPCCASCKLREVACFWGGRQKPFGNRNRERLYINALEEKVHRLSALVEDPGPCFTKGSPKTPSDPVSTPTDCATRTKPSCSDAAPSPHAVKEFASLNWHCLNASGMKSKLFSGPGSFSIFERKGLACFVNTEKPTELAPSVVYSTIDEFSRQEELKGTLRDFFLQSINKHYQFVEPPWLSFMSKFPQNGPGLQLLYGVIFAVSAHCLHIGPDLENALLAFSERLVPLCYKMDTSLPVIRAISILSWLKHTVFQQSEGFAYQYIALGLSAQLPLDKSPCTLSSVEDDSKLDYIDSVRTFWSLFMVESTSTPSLGIPLAIPWDVTQVPDCSGTLLGSGDPSHSYEYHCQLLRLNHLFVDHVYTPAFRSLSEADQQVHLQKATRALEQFKNDVHIDDCIVEDVDLKVDRAVVWISFNAALLNLHRPFLAASSDYKSKDPGASLEAAVAAADAISDILRHIDQDQDLGKLPPFVIFHILRAALVHCVVMTYSDKQMRSKGIQNLEICLVSLRAIGKIWEKPAFACVKFLTDVVQAWGLEMPVIDLPGR